MDNNNYVLTQDGNLVTISDEELYHYGVLGMKWGVRRASNKLSKATTDQERDKAISKLEKHRSKASSKVAKLEKKLPKLQKSVEKNTIKNDTKAANLHNKAAIKRNKAYNGLFVTQKRASSKLYEANRLDAKAGALMAKSQKAKAKVEQNKALQEAFNRGISDIDKLLVNNGKKYLGAG